jgi:hypothetical protein
MMEAASTTETSVNFHQTKWRNIPEESFSGYTVNVDSDNDGQILRKRGLLVTGY